MYHSFNPLNQIPYHDSETKVDSPIPESDTRKQFEKEFNCLYQSPSSINLGSKNTPRITNMQEMYNNSIFINFLHSMFPN